MKFPVLVPFVEHLGAVLQSVDQDQCEISHEPLAVHLNSHGVTHGGVLMTLLDVAMATAARSGKAELGVVTIEMKTSFMQPARGPLTVRANVKQRTTNMVFAEASVYDSRARACAHATGTFKFVHRGDAGATVITD